MRNSSTFPNVQIDGSRCADPFGNHLLDMTPDQYETDVQLTLDNIRMTNAVSGRLVFRWLANCGGKRLIIQPTLAASDTIASEAETSAVATDTDAAISVGEGGTDAADGTHGSDCTISYIRQTWTLQKLRSARGKQFKADDANYTPEDFLLHELVHALRFMLGNSHRNGTVQSDQQELGAYENRFEEFAATLVTNIYASETGRSNAIRGDHGFNFAAEKTAGSPRAYTMHYQHSVARFIADWPAFARALGAIDTPFNPIRRIFNAEAETAAALAEIFARNLPSTPGASDAKMRPLFKPKP